MNLYAHYYADSLAYSLVVLHPDLRRHQFTWGRFRNGELYVHLNDVPVGDCCVLGSIEPPEERLAAYLLLCDTVKRRGAHSITAILPYLAYSRQDRPEPGMSLAAAWTGQLLQASGVDRVLTLDLHSRHSIELYPIPLRSISVAGLWANCIETVDEETAIVSPDEGGIARCEELRDALKASRTVVHCRKERTRTGVSSQLVGSAPKKAIVVDDILDTGNTLVACCERLAAAGTKHISVYVTHGLFTGSNWQRLWELRVDRITCTDSVPISPPKDDRISIIACAPAIAAGLRAEVETKELVHA